MKFKRLLSLLLVVFMLVTFVSCGNKATTEPTTDETEKITQTTEVTTTQAPEPDPATAKPLLYRVTDLKGNVVWLFGSIHVGREDYYPLPRYVLKAFNDSDSLAVEADIVAFEKDMNAQMSAIAKLVYTDQSSIKENIPEDVYNDAVEILKEYDSYIPAMDYYYPAMWSSTIDSLMIEELGEEVFICVGSAHVVGEGAMADLLAKRGYKVELVTK